MGWEAVGVQNSVRLFVLVMEASEHRSADTGLTRERRAVIVGDQLNSPLLGRAIK
jgi:hypothetical protein